MRDHQDVMIKIIEDQPDMDAALEIRKIVFVDEQKVDPEIEYDEFEAVATHVLARIHGVPVGTARWRQTATGFKLERFAVLGSVRGQGVGAALVSFILAQLDLQQIVYLNSQVSAIDFYSKMGFRAQGPVFYEANIPHRKMIYRPGSAPA